MKLNLLPFIKNRVHQHILKQWYVRTTWFYALMPLMWVYKVLEKHHRNKSTSTNQEPFKVPLWVVGNIHVGGMGKSPFIMWLIEQCQNRSIDVGVVMRGYGSNLKHPREVCKARSVLFCGDEAFMIKNRYPSVQVWVGRNRKEVVDSLLKSSPRIQLVLSDDGLQHRTLHRDLEWVLMDRKLGLGNGFCLPVGPLRQPFSSVSSNAQVVYRNGASSELSFHIQPSVLVNMKDESVHDLRFLKGKTVHAIAGIAHPHRFFSLLRELGASVIEYPLPDHCSVKGVLTDDRIWVMTEKDQIKYHHSVGVHVYYLRVSVSPTETLSQKVALLLKEI